MIKTVFCIDDDLITLALCEMVIKKAAFAEEVVTAKNGKEGLNYFSTLFSKTNTSIPEEPPQLIFLDLNMPVMNGWDFLEEYLMKYSDRLPQTSVVIVSSTVNPEDFSRANRYDIVIDFINKPLTVEGMEELMENEKLQAFFQN
jgi:CheY-like chemotaxis protein